ncbi:DUF4367 domain-containing protein [Candidatus Saccharibacteria bacterium]|nr:DUF4367 domain-containing protein [Candidatus Saccharibacteria bacterium]
MSQHTVTIKGTVYDKRTGMPVRLEREAHNTTRQAAQAVHQQPQHSRTLNRKYVVHEREIAQGSRSHTAVPSITHHKRAASPTTPISRSESISRFATQYNAEHAPVGRKIADIGPTSHPLQRSAHAKMISHTPAQKAIKPSQVIKHEAIAQALAQAPKAHGKQHTQKTPLSNSRRKLSIASASLAIVLLGGYFTYLSMPQLSTRVAAAQAGINATYPNYQPTGYSLNGPVAYSDGNVTMKFAANAAPIGYTLTQSRSGWDSSAVLENYIYPTAGKAYNTTTINGLTIYTFDNNAAWVNGGILYTVTGNATLSSNQIERIATSM